MFERWKWSMNDIVDLYWDEFWDLAEARSSAVKTALTSWVSTILYSDRVRD
jgi:hypothetical protein